MITAGIDIGSTTSKALILEDGNLLDYSVITSGSLPADSARKVFDKCCKKSGIDISKIMAVATTGYGRRLANFGDMVITEIKACALGTVFFKESIGDVYTIIDVGGQDTKVIALNDKGEVEDFAMNDKCAAGTGRFLEMLAHKLEVSYEDFVELALTSKTMIQMNSTCAVFAESEVVSLLAKNVHKADIAMAAHNAIADRIGSMIRRVGQKELFCFTGGGALNQALINAIKENLNKEVCIPKHPQIIVALGAAIAAQNKLREKK